MIHLRTFLWINCLILSQISSQRAETEEPQYWYKGCFRKELGDTSAGDHLQTFDPLSRDHITTQVLENTLHNERESPLATRAAQICSNLGYLFSLTQCDGHYLCSNSTVGFQRLLDGNCSSTNLPCGFGDTWALYSTSGPYVSHVTAKVSADWLTVGIPVALETTVELSRITNLTQSLADRTWPLQLHVDWDFQGDSFTNATVTVQEREVYTRIQHTFTGWGQHQIEVCASTVISRLCELLEVHVLDPSPRDLQLVPVAKETDVSSCIPETLRLPEYGQQFFVFKDAHFTLEATVAVGNNLTFTFHLLEDNIVQTFRPNGSDDCYKDECLTARNEFSIHEVGVYQILVTVENQHGETSKNITVAVVERSLSNLTFKSKSIAIATPGQPVEFHVSVTLTSRLFGLLTVHFGDGDTHEAKLEDTNSTSFALQCDQGQMIVESSYGNGCDLHIEFEHSFSEEGTYIPSTSVTSKNVTLTSLIALPVTVMNKLSGAKIQSDKTVAVNKSTEMVLHLSSRSEAMEVVWMISSSTSNDVLLNTSTATTHIHHRFTSSGVYSVTVVAKNLISQATASSYVLVQDPIINVFLSCEHAKFVSTGEEIECLADIFHGTNPSFAWKFHGSLSGKPISSKHGNLSSAANYLFQNLGQYNVTVVAYNAVSKTSASLASLIHVLDPVTCVGIQSSGPTMLGEQVIFQMTICQGSDVKFEFDFGRGRQSHGYQPSEYEGVYYSSFTFVTAGIHDVTIFAFNKVSEVSHTTHVLVQERIPAMDLEPMNGDVITIGVPTTLVAVSQGEAINRRDLVYTWSFADGQTNTSAVPVIHKVFSESGRQFINFTAHNFVDKLVIVWEVDVQHGPAPLCHMVHLPAVPVGEEMEFTPKISGNARPMDVMEIDFGDDVAETDIDESKRIMHTYDKPGLYKVKVTCEDALAGTKMWTSLVVVDEPISGLRLVGPTVVEIERLLRDYMWKAEVGSGSNIVYGWDTGGGVVNNTTLSMFMKGFSEPGVYKIYVKAHNSVSQMSAMLVITVQYPVLDTMVTIDPSVLNQSTVINTTVHGGREFKVVVDFGDGSVLNTSSEQLTEQELSSPRRSYTGVVPIYTVLISHMYAKIGTYEVTVNISNLISYIVKSKTAIVEEPIGGIQLTTDSPRVVSVVDPVIVMVTVATGRDLSFDWDFSDEFNPDLDVQSTANTSTASHTFSMANEYQVSVAISNPYYRQPVVAKLPFLFHVVESIDGVFIDVNGKYGAPVKGRGVEQSTPEIEFHAGCERGTDVMFLFDFGDGMQKMVDGEIVFPFYYFRGRATHRFTQEGVYNITVTAINPLGKVSASLDKPFFVQAPSIGLKLEKSEYGTKIGDVTTLRAFNSRGTNVTFDWKLGDQSDLIKDGGPVVNHTYKSPGVYEVMVMARNQVSNLTDRAKVFVQQELQGVNINVTSASPVFAIGDEIEFIATVFPVSTVVMYYEWNFGDTAITKQSFQGTVKHAYARFGRFIVTAKAYNLVSHATSTPVEVKVLSKVKNLEIVLNGRPMVNMTLTFTAWIYSGSDYTLTWDFGDDTSLVTSNDYREEIKHTYTSVGEYFVILTAENDISKEVARKQLFVLDLVCLPPEVQLHGHDKGKIRINGSDTVFIESEIKSLICEDTTMVSYRWSLYNQTSGQLVTLRLTDHSVLRQKILYLPPWTIPVGKYIISLKVYAKGTIVYTTKNVTLEVAPPPIQAIMNGGLLREVTRKDIVILDGSNSLDLDNNNTDSLRYNWTCSTNYRLDAPSFDCFNEEVNENQITLNTSIVSFPANWLKEDVTRFLFTLKVNKEGSNSEVTQAIEINEETEMMLRLSIHCPQCDQGLVNSHEMLRLQAVCHQCDLKETEFHWTVETLMGGANQVINDITCVAADGSSYWSLKLNDSTSTTQTVENEKISTAALNPDIKPTAIAEVNPPEVNQPDFPFPRIDEGKVENGRLNSRKDKFMASNKTNHIQHSGSSFLGSDFDITIEENTATKSRRRKLEIPGQPPIMEIGEGMPGESGSSGGRFPGKYPDLEEKLDNTGRKDSGREEDRVQDSNTVKYNYHILTKERYGIPFRDSKTTTGLKRQALVIKPGQLLQGRTYVITVTAKTKDGTRRGKAMTSFTVNKSPSRGDCQITPRSGSQMETKFRVFCREWQDEHTPLQYEVSYSVGQKQSNIIVYRGLQRDFSFTLPAGDVGDNYKVNVSIAILDSIGGKTTICRIPIKVVPGEDKKLQEQGKLPEEILWDEVRSPNGSFAALTDKGDNRMLKVLIRYVALRLNKLSNHGDDPERKSLRRSLRFQLTRILFDLPSRNELEVLQTVQALVPLTEVWSELDRYSLDLVVRLNKAVADQLTILSETKMTGNQELSFLAVRATSSIIHAAAEFGRLDNKDVWFYNRSLVDSIDALERIMKTELSFHATGENPIRSKDSFVSTMAVRFNQLEAPKLRINETTAYLMGNMEEIVERQGWKIPEDEFSPMVGCFQAHLSRFKHNPYTFVQHETEKVRSEVCSLRLYTCDGRPLEVKDLKGDNNVHLEVPRLQDNSLSPGRHQLSRSQMNVHRFNMSRANLQHSFHLHLEFDGETKGRLFPISLMIGYQNIPTPSSHIYKQDFTEASNIKIFLKAGYFNVSGEYYLGVVDTKFNAGRRREGEITVRNYTLKVWWTKCLYWDQSKTKWSSYGCQATENSTYRITHCQCNHLSTFGTFFDSVSSSLFLVPVDNFFPPNKNFIAVSLIGTILCVYAVLIFLCQKADLHDARKGGISYLHDNSLSDQQQYEVTVETGLRKGAGTTAKISIILHGEEGMSETRELISDDDRPLFERNSRDKFIMTLPESIGKIWKVQIWHNNFGSSPSWYLNRVIVKDLSAGNVYYFICEKWLAVEEDDGKVEREFMAVEGNLGFRRVFWAKGTQYMADYHLWTSLFTCPPHSPFRRVHRLSVCVTLLFLYMCLNTIVYHPLEIQYRGEFGLLDLSWMSVTIGVVCSTVAIPCYLILTILFRKSKQGFVRDKDLNPDEDKDDQQYPSGKPNEHSQSEEEEEEDAVQPIMTYSILDQSILNWPSIQDWAQKQWVKRQNAGLTGEENGTASHESPPQINRSLYTRVISTETDQASSGFEDSNSTDPRPQMTVSSQASSVKNKASSVSNSNAQPKVTEVEFKKSHTRCFLPFWFQYVALSLCAIISIACIIISIWYCFRFGGTKSVMWLQSVYISVIVCVFITQPLMVLIAVLYTAVRYRNDLAILDHYEDGGFGERARAEILRRKKEQGENGNSMEDLESGVAARQRSRYLRFARPPQEKQLIEARKKIMKEKQAKAFIRDCVTFLIAFTLVCVMAYGKGSNSIALQNQAFQSILHKSGSPSFDGVKSPVDWYDWCRNTLIENIGTEDNSTAKLHQRPILHGNAYVIGDVLLRQLKVKGQPCVYTYKLPYAPEVCHHGYSSINRLDHSVGPNNTWKYHSGSGATYIRGRHGTYDDSGYVVKLERTKQNATAQINLLETSGWIDSLTRAVIVEFTTYNAPLNLFSSIVLLLETPESGGFFPQCHVASSYIFRYVTKQDSFVLACELIFILMIIWQTKIEICDMFKMKRQYIHNGWKILEMATCIVSLFYILCYMYRFLVVSATVENLRSTYYEQFVNVSEIVSLDEMIRSEVGLILFLVTLKCLRLLRYSEKFAIFGNTYRRGHKEITIFSALFAGLIIAFSSMGHILFRSVFSGFRDLWTSVFTMTALLTGNLWQPYGEGQYVTSTRIFVFTFCVFTTAFLLGYVVAFLSFRLRLSKHKQRKILSMGVKDTVMYFWENFLLWSGFKEPDIYSEPDNTLPPEFTMAEIEYQVEELLFRISALSGSHSLPEKPTTELTDSDEVYAVGDDGISSGGSEVHLVEDDRLDYRVHKIEEGLCSQEPFLAHLLKLDSINAGMISLDREKQLKSHLELEIFRQLQMQRQNPNKNTSSGSNGQSDTSTDSYTHPSHPGQQLLRNHDRGGGPSISSPLETDVRHPLRHLKETETRHTPAATSVSDIQPEFTSSSNPDSPEELLKNQNRHRKSAASNYSKVRENVAASGKVVKPLERQSFKKPELPVKPTFKNPGLSSEISKPSLLNSPALKQLRNTFGSGDKNSGKGGESNSGSTSMTTESSSGSEQDAIHGLHRNIGRRNLRKTKSRGKGKGSVSLSESLIDEFEAEEQETEGLEEENQQT